MSGKQSRKLRQLAKANGTDNQPKKFSRPFIAMLPEGEVGEDGKKGLIPVQIPRKQRRIMIAKMITDAQKGRIHGRGQEQER